MKAQLGTKEFNDSAMEMFGGKPKQQTAVEWLEQEIFRRYKFTLQQLNCQPLEEAIKQAKEMEENLQLEMVHKFAFDYTYNYRGEKTLYEYVDEWFEEYKRLEEQLKTNKIMKNIHITSDEEIKEGDWIFDIVTKKIEIAKFNHNDLKRDWKKIILTTDQDLIKDGVQAIDDDFLEWFVSNSNCEYVDVDKTAPIRPFGSLYKIIIPKEEPNQETLEEVGEYQQELFNYLHDLGVTALQTEMQEIERIVLGMQKETTLEEEAKQDWFCPNCDSYVSSESVTFEETHQICNTGVIVKEEPKQSIKDRIMSETSEETKQKARDYANSLVEKQEPVFENAKLILRKHILKNKEQVIKDLDEMRKLSNEQEILEEAALIYASKPRKFGTRMTFIDGAKWQQERSYSEEDMAESFMACWKANVPEGFECKLSFKEWFEQFKNK